jgi:AP-3 complex subunit delta-1
VETSKSPEKDDVPVVEKKSKKPKKKEKKHKEKEREKEKKKDKKKVRCTQDTDLILLS